MTTFPAIAASPLPTRLFRLGAVLGCLAFVGPIAASAAEGHGGNPDLGGHTLRIVDDGRALEFTGGITFGLTKEVRALLDANAGIRTLRLTSKGGRVQEARLLVDLLRQRGIVTYVARECLSACAIAFMGGAQRLVAPGGQIGFHRDRDAYGTKQAVDDSNDTEHATLIEEGVAPWFADRAFSTPSESMWTPPHAELLRANVITGVAPVVPAPASDVGTEVDAEFQAIPVFVAIKKAEPSIYAKIRAAAIDAVANKRSTAELAATVTPYMQALTRSHLPTASDAAIIEFAKVVNLELSEIQAHSPEDCYAFGYLPPGAKPFNMVSYLSTEVLLREQAALARVIETTAQPPAQPITDKDITPSRNYVMGRLIDKFGGADVEAYANARSPKPDRATVCRMTIAFYNEVFALPPDEQARLLRFILIRSYAANGG
jgi:hypothetical protein